MRVYVSAYIDIQYDITIEVHTSLAYEPLSETGTFTEVLRGSEGSMIELSHSGRVQEDMWNDCNLQVAKLSGSVIYRSSTSS